MSIINIYRSAFDDSYETITVDKNISIREALPELDYENSIIAVNGFETDENYILKEGDICTIRKFPTGKPGSSPLEIFLGVVTLGIYTTVDAIVSGATGKTIGQHVQQGLMNWLAPDLSDTATNTADSLEGIPQLRGAKNQTNRNKPIPLVLGEHLYTPMFIGSPYTEIAGPDGEDQYYNVLYLLGWGKLKVNDIKLGPVSGIAKNSAGITDGVLSYNDDPSFCDPSFAASNPQLELRQTAREVDLYPQRVVEERLNIELMNVEGGNPLEVIRFSAKNPQKVQIEIMLNNGLISYNEKGEKKDASVSIKVEWRGTTNGAWQEFVRIGTSGGSSPTSYNSSTHITTITRQKAKVMRFVAEKTFSYAQATAAINRTLELRIVRTNAKATDNRTSDTAFLTAIRTWCFDYEASQAAGTMVIQRPMIQKYRDQTARLGFRIKATDNLQGTIDALNCMVTSYARTWNGSYWTATETPTNNPAAVALKILQSPALGNNAYPDSMLDLNSFGEFYEWCENREYSCNGVLTSERRVDDLLNSILSTGRGMRILNGNRYGVLIDKPRENAVTVLNSQNVLEAKNQKNFDDLPDGLSIKFVNKDDGYQETEVYVMANGSSRPEPTSRIEAMEVPFVTDYRQVIKNGRYLLACRHLRPETWIRKLSTDGYLVGIGNRVDVQDDTIVVGIGEGAAITGLNIQNNYITEIQTDGVFDVVDMNKLYGIKIMQFDGVNPGKVRTIQVSIPVPGVYSNFTVSIPLNSDPPLPQIGNIVSFGEYEKITTPALCFGKKANGDGTFEVTLIPYQEGIYTTDSGPIPPYEANITTPQGLAPINEIPPEQMTRSELIELSSEFAGTPATIFRLRPSADVIRKNQNGVMSPNIISCEQFSITGSGKPIPSDRTIKYQTNLTQGEEYYTGPLNVNDNWQYIRFLLYDNDVLLDFEDIPILSDGVPAITFELLPSVTVVRKFPNGVIDPPTITCEQRSRTGNSDPVTSAKDLVYITTANATEIPYTGDINIDPAWDWIEFRLRDGTTILDAERVSILSDGSPATVFDVLPSVQVIRKFSNGTTDPVAITCAQQMTVGNSPPVVSNKTLVYTTSLSGQETTYTGAITVNPAWSWIEFRLKDGSTVLDTMRVPILADGTPGTSFDLLPSVSVIRMDARGNLQPGTISCEQQVIVGGDAPTPSQKTLKYKSSTAATETPYTGPINIDPAWKWIEFSLYDGSFLLDRERVPVLAEGRDGNDAVTLDLLNDSKMITCDIDGVPIDGILPYTNKATLFRGQTEITKFSEMPYDMQNRIYQYPSTGTNIMQPISLSMYPVSIQFVFWSIPNAPAGVTIDQDGNITIADGAALSERDELIIRAVYNGNTFERIFTVIKMRLAADGVPGTPGRDGITYYTWIRYADDAQGNGISNDPAGKKYIGFAYNRITPVESDNPSDYTWSLIRGADGEQGVPGPPGDDGTPRYTWIKYSDNPDGTGMYQQPTDTTRYIGIAVNKETPEESDDRYDYVWSRFKGDDGESPVIIRLLDDNKSISCDMFGNPLTLPFTTQAYMYKGNDLISVDAPISDLIRTNIVRFPGSGTSIFSPSAGAFYPVNRRTITWSIQGPFGVSISDNGIITVAENTALSDVTQILVTGTFEGEAYTTSLNLTKVYAGEDSLVVELLADSISLPCDEYGDPKPEAFPITNRATYHVGISQAAIPVWTLINAPTGVTINSLGIIRMERSFSYADINKITVRGTYNGIIRESVLTITKVLDGVAPVTLNISPDSETISYDHNGVPKPGQLPFTIKATLFKGTMEVTDLFWRQRIMRKQVMLFPGSGTNIFSPLATGIYPVSTQAVQWSLSNAPSGVTIDSNGIISLSPNVELATSNIITVNAVFDGKTYSRAFTVNKVQDGAPGIQGIPGQDGHDGQPGAAGQNALQYLGKTVTKTTTNIVYIKHTDTYSANVSANIGDYIAFVGTSDAGSSVWKKNYCLQWNGTQWVQLDPLNSANTDYYMRALRDITEGAEVGAFSVLFAQKIMAMEATIEALETTLLKVKNAIYGGPRFTKNPQGQLVDNGETLDGFKLGFDGKLIASGGIFNGRIEADEGFLKGSLFADRLESGPLLISSGAPKTITGTLPANATAHDIFGIIGAWGEFGATGNYNGAITAIKVGMRIGMTSNRFIVITDVYINKGSGEILIASSGQAYDANGVIVETVHSPRTQYALNFSLTANAMTMRLVNLPTNPAILSDSGTVYKHRLAGTTVDVLAVKE